MWPDPLDETKRKPRNFNGTLMNKISHKAAAAGICIFVGLIYAIGYTPSFIRFLDWQREELIAIHENKEIEEFRNSLYVQGGIQRSALTRDFPHRQIKP